MSTPHDPPSPAAAGDATRLLEIGRIARAHGLRGDVVVVPITNVADRRFVVGAEFVDASGRNLRLVRVHADKGGYIVAVDGVNDRDAAEALRGTVLLAPPLDDPDEWWVHELVGATVVLAADGAAVGTITDVIDNPAADLLELDSGALVPVTFAVEFRRGDATVVIDPPKGLLDL